MKYLHAHHAGNFADTVKHLVLLELLRALGRKPAGFFYLETHAGRGRYRFDSPAMGAGEEHHHGIGQLRAATGLEPPLSDYVALVGRLGTDAGGALQHYTGSPLLAAAQLRPQDRAVLFELDAIEAAALRVAVQDQPKVVVRTADGYQALRSELPPRERRGLVLIDPAYEAQEAEFDLIMPALLAGYARWPTGVYAIWYPIKRRAASAAFHARLKESGLRRILCAELCLYPDDSRVGLNGCGLAIVNPPWQIDATLSTALPALHRALNGRPGTGAECFWLVPE